MAALVAFLSAALIAEQAAAISSLPTSTKAGLAVVKADVSSISVTDTVTVTDVESMRKVFFRSSKVHTASMASLLGGLTVAKALEILQQDNLTTPVLTQIAEMEMATGRQSNLRQPKQSGYASLESARKLLNDMIYEAEEKYDAEIAACTEFYQLKCSALEKGRSDLLASNFVAASSRTLMSVASANIERCTAENQASKVTLEEHNKQCAIQSKEIKDRLTVVEGDIAILTTILEMTACTKSTGLLQLRRCQQYCSNTTYIEFLHHSLQEKIDKLRLKLSHDLFQDTMRDLFDGIQGLKAVDVLLAQEASQDEPKKAKVSIPALPTPKTPKAAACADPHKGAPPPPGSKRGGSCTLTPGSCFKLQSRFLHIQAGIVDEKEELQLRLARLGKKCFETKILLEGKIEDCKSTIQSSNSDLADATGKESKSSKESAATALYNQQLSDEVKGRMTTCRSNYAKLEGEQCALKKIRGELYKMKGDKKQSGLFADCTMGPWVPGECSKKCGGGEMNLTRVVASAADGGAKCLPQRQVKSCNAQRCPEDCVQEAWSGWSKCSSKCGGGVEERLRKTVSPAKYGGKPCGDTKQQNQCNAQACDADCKLSQWTKWSACSKDCGGGTKKRVRYVVQSARGAGKCPNRWKTDRLQYTQCGMRRCTVSANHTTRACLTKKLDMVMLLDGSTSMTKKGWDNEVLFAKKLVHAFVGSSSEVNSQVAVIVYSGPRDWNEWRTCFNPKSSPAKRKATCRVNTVTHLTSDLAKLEATIDKLEWPKGGTLSSLALKTAQDELVLGRKNVPANVVMLTDGKPMSPRWTKLAARSLRKKARLLWVPVTGNAPLKDIKKWATRRWQENVFQVRSFDDLKTQSDSLVTHVVASICPDQ